MKLYTNIQSHPHPYETNQINTNSQFRGSYQPSNFGSQPPHPLNSSFGEYPPSSKDMRSSIPPVQLVSLPSHISYIEEGNRSSKLNRKSVSFEKSKTPRKKIFNANNLVSKLMQPISEHIRAQVNNPPIQNNDQFPPPLPPQNLVSYIKPREKHNKEPQVGMAASKPIEQSYRKGNRSFQQQNEFDRQAANQILSQPILFEKRNMQVKNLNQSLNESFRNQLLNKIPQMMQKIQKNEQQITSLNRKLQQLMNFELIKNDNLKKQLELKEKLLREKQSVIQAEALKVMHKQHTLEKGFQIKSQLQKQQVKRLQLLIQENKHLSRKVMEKKMNNSSSSPKRDPSFVMSRQVPEKRIVRQRQQIERVPNYLNNLDISIIPLQRQRFKLSNSTFTPSSPPSVQVNGTRLNVERTQRINQKGINQNYRQTSPSKNAVPIKKVAVTKIY